MRVPHIYRRFFTGRYEDGLDPNEEDRSLPNNGRITRSIASMEDESSYDKNCMDYSIPIPRSRLRTCRELGISLRNLS